MFMNSWANMVASTVDNADAVDPGVDGGTVEAESPLENDDSGICDALLLTLGQTDAPVDMRQGKARFRRHWGGESG